MFMKSEESKIKKNKMDVSNCSYECSCMLVDMCHVFAESETFPVLIPKSFIKKGNYCNTTVEEACALLKENGFVASCNNNGLNIRLRRLKKHMIGTPDIDIMSKPRTLNTGTPTPTSPNQLYLVGVKEEPVSQSPLPSAYLKPPSAPILRLSPGWENRFYHSDGSLKKWT